MIPGPRTLRSVDICTCRLASSTARPAHTRCSNSLLLTTLCRRSNKAARTSTARGPSFACSSSANRTRRSNSRRNRPKRRSPLTSDRRLSNEHLGNLCRPHLYHAEEKFLENLSGGRPWIHYGWSCGEVGEIDMARHLVLFVGGYNDTDGVRGLWETNGTTAGTSELTGISGSPIEAYGLATFGNEVLFNGEDTSGNYGLWVTNGTAAGTSELTGITGADPGYLYPYDLTVFKGEVLFQGRDNGSDGIQGLWVTNGTAAGTHELTGITGADPGSEGLIPLDLTVFGNEVLFNGTDASDSPGLWVTNGTAAGTSELGISGASPSGINPSDLTVFGNRVLFAGTDATGYTFPGTGNVDL